MQAKPDIALPPMQSAAGISFRESGRRDAPALVLLHGIGSTSAAWRLQYGPLGENFRVVGWDAPGYGGSPPLPDEAPSVEAYAQALARLLDAIGVQNTILGSNSWGTPTAVCFARLHPQRVRALVLGGPAAGWSALSADERARRVAERIERITRLGPEKMRQEDSARLVAPGTRAEVLDWIRNSAGLTVAGYSQAVRMLAAADVVRDIKHVTCPLTVVSGDKDIVTPPDANARPIVAAAPNATLETVAGSGHLPHLEFPERFNEIVFAMLRQVQS